MKCDRCRRDVDTDVEEMEHVDANMSLKGDYGPDVCIPCAAAILEESEALDAAASRAEAEAEAANGRR